MSFTVAPGNSLSGMNVLSQARWIVRASTRTRRGVVARSASVRPGRAAIARRPAKPAVHPGQGRLTRSWAPDGDRGDLVEADRNVDGRLRAGLERQGSQGTPRDASRSLKRYPTSCSTLTIRS